MRDLARTQADFSAAMRATAAPPGLRGEPALAARRFEVYRNNVRLLRMNALAAAYPVVRSIAGADFFTGTARCYALGHDSAGGDLNEYGEAFAGFLAAFEPARELPYLPDVARLEWLAHRAYYAADAVAIEPARLAGLAQHQWGSLRFELQPAAALLRSPWPLARIWEVNQPGYTGEMAVDFTAAEHFALLTRPGFEVAVCSISAGEYAFLKALSSGFTLTVAVDAALAAAADFDLSLALTNAVKRGVFADFSVAAEPAAD
jgi:hypothetical protein